MSDIIHHRDKAADLCCKAGDVADQKEVSFIHTMPFVLLHCLSPRSASQLHCDSFLVRESLGLLADRGGALGGLLRVLLWAHRNLFVARAPAQRVSDRISM